MNAGTEQRRLAAIVFTDMVGYSALAQRNEALALELLDEHRRIVRGLLPRHTGREVKTTGDGFLIEFSSALAAVQCAVGVQQTLHERNQAQPPERQVRIRIGIHVGDVVLRDGDIHGDGVNIAARLEPLAPPGGICVSNAVFEQVRNKLPHPLTALGPADLKNIESPVVVHRVELPWLKAGSRQPAEPPGLESALRNPRFGIQKRFVTSPARWVWLTAAVALIVGLGAWGLAQRGRAAKTGADPRTPASSPAPVATGADPQKSIAVLPFVSLSADKADEYLSDGMTEELLNVLAQVPGLRVPGRSSSFAFKGRTEEGIFRKVGEQLQVTTVLEGSVRKAGDKLRITVQLINAADGFHLWSQTYDRGMNDILAVQTEVAQQVVQALQVKLGVEAARALAKAPTQSPEAHRLYLLGRHSYLKNTEESGRKAVEYFKQALQQDPGYARAYAGLADTWDWRQAPREFFPQVRGYAESALRLDPTLAEAHFSLGWIYLMGEWDFARAEKEFREAIRLNPNLALARDGYAWWLTYMGRFEEAEIEQKKAVDLDPLSPYTLTDLAFVYEYARKFDASVQAAQQALEVDPAYAQAYYVLGWSLLYLGRVNEAIPRFEQSQRLDDSPFVRSSLGCAHAVAGDRARALAVLQELGDLAGRRYVPPMAHAVVWSLLNEKERTLDQLERCLAERDPYCVLLKTDPAFERIRAEPRFQALLGKVGFPE